MLIIKCYDYIEEILTWCFTLASFSNTKNSTMKSYTKNTFKFWKKLPYKSNIKK